LHNRTQQQGADSTQQEGATMTGLIRLRDYQTQMLDAVERAIELGETRMLAVLYCGAGKTICFSELAHRRKYLGRTLILAHRDELCRQAVDKLRLVWPDVEVGVVKGDVDEVDARDVVVASVQTISREKRLARLLASPTGEFATLITDECHHSPSNSYMAIYDALDVGEFWGPVHLGVTATPDRGDGVGLRACFDRIVFERDAAWAIERGFMVKPIGLTVRVDLTKVKTTAGDYQSKDLSDTLELQGAHVAIARIIKEKAADRKTLCFTPTVEFAHLVAEECSAVGLPSAVVSADTPTDERQRIYADLEAGRIKVLANCAVLIEGFDETSIDCVVMARPTKSRSLYVQAVGRGLRLHPGKENCLVISLAGSDRYKLATLASLGGRRMEDALKEREAAANDVEEIGGQEVFDLAFELIAEERRLAKEADLVFSEVDLIGKVRERVSWASIDPDRFAKRGGDKERGSERVAVLKRSEGGLWACLLVEPAMRGQKHRFKALIEDVDLGTAQNVGEDWLGDHTKRSLIDPNAKWRLAPISPGQVKALQAAKIQVTGNTKGWASDALDVQYLKQTARAV
jgi:ATP-dependent helicase IRC3